MRHATVEVDGKTLSHGDEFTVRGEGRFAFRYGWGKPHPTEVTAWGPVTNPQQSSWRTFRLDDITTIHRKKQEHPK